MAHKNSDPHELSHLKSSCLRYCVKLRYHHLILHVFFLAAIPMLLESISSTHISLQSVFVRISVDIIKPNSVSISFCFASLVLLFKTRPRNVYLLNFARYKPKSTWKVSRELFTDMAIAVNIFTEKNLEFQKKILETSGLGQETYLPEALTQIPPNPCIAEALNEAKMVMFGAIDELLDKTKVKVKDIGILIVNCSLFNPTPSLSTMVINHYKLKDNILSFNLSGMGCSASIISIDLVKKLLQVHADTYALVVSTENITQNWYLGNDRSMLIPNCLFRVGGTAIMLSNRSSDSSRSKYQLIHTVRTHKGMEDKSYHCAYQKEDENNKRGISFSKDLIAVAGEALKENIITLGPLVLPMPEKLLLLGSLVARKVFKMKIQPYVPNFKLAFEHFYIHAGGKAVLDEVERNLELTKWHMEPSRMTLYRYGNNSSSSLWYQLAYTEAKGRINKGHRMWQIAFGAGFKCNSAVWQSLQTINATLEKNPWVDEINNFPLHIPE
ncbi:hypothetical protein Cgig2_006287 [Carnegiea gigantea]|uniref:3-ketoacyl-CoA synthase n=1 Tax=Carnegiea gigantea TaxID=171969 RepID=A0A9Q1GQ48_9CARY|nr:hypothetical protein Cgig2_006287 [Carnegiea gigantea]